MNKKIELYASFNKGYEEDDDDLIIEGMANVAVKDRMDDIIPGSAYSKGGLDNYRKNPIVLFNHNYSKPIGKTVELIPSELGLGVKVQISKAAGDVYTLIKEGIIKTFSIGFRVLDADYNSETDIFVIKDLELYEISCVAVPANQDSVFSVSKQLDELKQEYKQEFAQSSAKHIEDAAKATESIDNSAISATMEKSKMNEQELQAKLDAMQKELDATKGNLNAAEDLLDDVAAKDAKTKAETEKEAGKIAVKSQVEDLIKEVEKRFEEKEATMEEALKGLEADLKDKSDEITAITRNKMSFQDNGSNREVFTKEQREATVLVSKLLGKDIKDTKIFRDVVQKSGLEHTPSADWEQEFNTSIFNDMRDKLVLEPLFKSIAMTTPSMQIPINPEAGDAQWIATSAFRSTDGTSTGTGVDHKMGETTLVAHKLASKEYIGYEEEEDTILAIVPIIRDAVTRRMARTSDQSILRGTGTGTGGDAVSPFKGLTVLAGDASMDNATVAVAAKWTVDDLQAVRRQLGARGLNPGEVKYIVSEEAYYDLLEDPDFRTMDLVGDRATIIKGQIGSVNGSPVIVSDSFEAKAATKAAVVAVYTGNFFVGNLRNMMVERDKDITNQSNVIIATRRMGFLGMITGEGSATGIWVA